MRVKRGIMLLLQVAVVVLGGYGVYSITGEDSIPALLAKLVQTFPLGKSLLGIAVLPVADTMSYYDTFADWLQAQEIPVPQHLYTEIGKLIFSSAILLVMDKITEKKLENRYGPISTFVFSTLATLSAGIVTDLVLKGLDMIAVMGLIGDIRDIMLNIYAGMLTVGGGVIITIFILSFGATVPMILKVPINVLKLVTTYAGIICVLAWYVETNSIILPAIAAMIWLLLIVVLSRGEQLITLTFEE